MSEGQGSEHGKNGNDKRRLARGPRSQEQEEDGPGRRVLQYSPATAGLYAGMSPQHGPQYPNQNPYNLPMTVGASPYPHQQQIYLQPQPVHSRSQMDVATLNAMLLQQQFQQYQQQVAQQHLQQQIVQQRLQQQVAAEQHLQQQVAEQHLQQQVVQQRLQQQLAEQHLQQQVVQQRRQQQVAEQHLQQQIANQQFHQSHFMPNSPDRNRLLADPHSSQEDSRSLALQHMITAHQHRNSNLANKATPYPSPYSPVRGLQGSVNPVTDQSRHMLAYGRPSTLQVQQVAKRGDKTSAETQSVAHSNKNILKEKSLSDIVHQFQPKPDHVTPAHVNSSSARQGEMSGNDVGATSQGTSKQSESSKRLRIGRDDLHESASSTSKSSRKPGRERQAEDDEDEEEEERSGRAGLGGENRLSIIFDQMGGPGNPPQTFGKSAYIIPTVLSGIHRMYSQEWRFRITHLRGPAQPPSHASENDEETDEVRLEWSITNVPSGTTVSMTETSLQARMRQSKGNTICNHVLRNALQKRVTELQQELLNNDKNWLQRANIESLIKELSPKKCAQGLLFFGLRHTIVQETIRNHMDSKQVSTPGAAKPS